MALIDPLFNNRVIKANPTLENENVQAFLLVFGGALMATAGIGKGFFEMDNLNAGLTGGSGAMIFIAGGTKRDATLYLLGIAWVTGTTVSMIKAYREGRFYVKVDLAELLRLGYDAWKDSQRPTTT